MNRSYLTFLVPVFIVFSFLFGYQAGKIQEPAVLASTIVNQEKDELATTTDLKMFWEVWKRLQEKFINLSVLIPKQMVYGAIRGMVSSLDDPYTVYMNPEETVEFKNNLGGTLEGIGAELSVKEKQLIVVSVLKDSPAQKAGLKANDIILEINDDTASDMTIYEAITHIRGERGTQVRLFILRKNGGLEPFQLTITRDKINLESVNMEDKGDGIYYIAVHQFTDRTSQEFKDAMKNIVLKDPKGLIIDVRSNGGGYLDVAVQILSELIGGKKEAVKIRRREPLADESIFLNDTAELRNVPLVVLVNSGSASASEILAGAIQDHKRGVLIGEKTFGKGSVQEVETLPDASSLRVTIAKWLTPSGRTIDHVGIEPDINVPLVQTELEEGVDAQLNRAIEYLKKKR